MSDLLVRVYQVLFGDAILVVIPERKNGQDVKRRILFDFGNALGGEGGQDAVLEAIIDDLTAELDGDPLDLYVMTHEHLDHVQGLFFAAERLNKTIAVKQAWLTGSAQPGYYKTHKKARKQKIAAMTAFKSIRARLQAAGGQPAYIDVLLANNDTSTTKKCVDFLRTKLTAPGAVHYVHREMDLSAMQPAKTAKIRLWGPEEDTSTYYGRFKAIAAGLGIDDDADFDAFDPDDFDDEDLALPLPPRGVDAGAFYNLVDIRRNGGASTLLAIDRASNNTSVVMLLEWNGWKLLFTGDAEKRSWRTMDKAGLVAPVHFLKVSHHGSHTGMPPLEILDKLLPATAPDGRPRRAAVSTHPKAYKGVPDVDTLSELRRRCDEVRSTEDLAAGEFFFDVTFPPA